MKKLTIFVLSGIILAGIAQAQEEKSAERPAWLPSLELGLDHASRYISEGNVGNPDPVNKVTLRAEWGITDNLSIHAEGLAIVDETDACNKKNNVEEWDWKLGATLTTPEIAVIGALEFNVDYIYYRYPSSDADVDPQEYEIDVNASDLFLSPGFAFVHDFKYNVIKANANVTYEQPLPFISEKLSFECPLELWTGNRRYTGCSKHGALYSLCLQPTLKYTINENLSICGYTLMAWALDSTVRRDWRDDENNNAFNICWGMSLTANF